MSLSNFIKKKFKVSLGTTGLPLLQLLCSLQSLGLSPSTVAYSDNQSHKLSKPSFSASFHFTEPVSNILQSAIHFFKDPCDSVLTRFYCFVTATFFFLIFAHFSFHTKLCIYRIWQQFWGWHMSSFIVVFICRILKIVPVKLLYSVNYQAHIILTFPTTQWFICKIIFKKNGG